MIFSKQITFSKQRKSIKKILKLSVFSTVALLTAQSSLAIDVPSEFNVSVVATGFGNISGITVDRNGRLFVSDVGAAGGSNLIKIDTDGSLTDISLTGLTYGAPGRMVIGDGRAPLGNDIILADWNTNISSDCCNGAVLKINPDTGVWSILSSGSPGVGVGDSFGVALGNGSAAAGDAPGSLYIMDFQGASSDIPFLYKLDHTGARSRVLDAASTWTTDQAPRHIVFGQGGDFGADLYVADNYSGNAKIWRVADDGSISAMPTSMKIASPTSIRFAPTGAFGDFMYILDVASHKLFLADSHGNMKVFASEIKGTEFSDMVFSADGRTLYLGLGDTVYAVKVNKCSEGL